VQVGRSFFTPPRDQVLQLGDGLEMWYGFYQSAILGWKPFVNIDGEFIREECSDIFGRLHSHTLIVHLYERS
jgi:hypothetical protein